MKTIASMDELERICEYIHTDEMFRLLINDSTREFIKNEFFIVGLWGNYNPEGYNKKTIRFNKQPYISMTEKKNMSIT